MDPLERQKVPLSKRTKAHYELRYTNGLPPGTDSIDQLEKNPRLPRPPATPKRPVPELPSISERKGHWLSKYLDQVELPITHAETEKKTTNNAYIFNQLDPETEYDQIIRVYSFHHNSVFMAALGYACVFIWLTISPSGAAAIHGGKVIRRGHQRFYETQLMNFRWIYYGSGSEMTKSYVDKINNLHASVWKKAPGTFSLAWDAQSAIILLSCYESLLRKMFGAKRDVHPQLKRAWPEWGERLTGWFKSEQWDGNPSGSFGINYPRSWEELIAFAEWLIDFDMDSQRSEEDVVKGRETAEAFIHQFSDLWFPSYLQFLGRALVLTCLPKKIRMKQRLEDPHPVLEWLIKTALRFAFDYGDSLPDPVLPEFEDFYHDMERWDMGRIDALHRVKREKQDRAIKRYLMLGTLLLASVLMAWRLRN